jgi:AraC family transcriptional regulator
MSSLSQVRPAPVTAPAGPREPTLADILLALLAEADASLESDRESTRNCLARASALITQATPDGGSATPVRGGLATWQARRIAQVIASGLAEPLPMADLASAVRLSTSHFSRAFKASFGMTPHAYILRRRVERAQDMMRTTAEPLSQIALACGFCDQAHLSRLFHRATGITPAAWRRHGQQRLWGGASAEVAGGPEAVGEIRLFEMPRPSPADGSGSRR